VTDPDRNNEPLDGILRRTMRAQPGPATPECADAESLAAYSERSVTAAQRERLETHFADCMRCQVLLADIARAGEGARGVQAASEVPWYRRWRIAIPALAAVAAVVVFIAMRRPVNEESQNAEVIAMAKREAPSLAMPDQAAAPAAPIAAPPAPSAPPESNEVAMDEARRATAPREEAKSATAPRARENIVAAPEAAPRTFQHPAAEVTADTGRVVAIAPAAPVVEPGSAAVGQPTASVSSDVATNQSQPEAAVQAGSMGNAPLRLSSRAASPGNGAMAAPMGGPPPPPVAGAAVGQSGAAIGAGSGAIAGAAAGGGGASPGAWSRDYLAESRPAAFASISSPDRSVAWIVGKNGSVQRRDADGTTHMQHSGVSTDLVAGSSPSARVCWIVGRSGTIIRTTDGERWERIGAPTTENLSAVSASSARDVVITTARGQVFATSDGGVTWRRQ
jgi:hypothetical protein